LRGLIAFKASFLSLAILIGTTVPSAQAQERPAQSALSVSQIEGAWTNTGSCANFIQFNRDGRMRNSAGQYVNWSLSAGILQLGSRRVGVRLVDPRTLELISGDGSTSRFTKCSNVRWEERRFLAGAELRNFLVGTWSDEPGCPYGSQVTFGADGRFRSIQVPNAPWRVEGNRVILSGGTPLWYEVEAAAGDARIVLEDHLGQSDFGGRDVYSRCTG
jgi:hypothetical protein